MAKFVWKINVTDTKWLRVIRVSILSRDASDRLKVPDFGQASKFSIWIFVLIVMTNFPSSFFFFHWIESSRYTSSFAGEHKQVLRFNHIHKIDAKWKMRLLRARFVETHFMDIISHIFEMGGQNSWY